MPEEPKIEENKEDSSTIVEVNSNRKDVVVAPMGIVGHKKLGGKKKGFRSAKVILRTMLDEMNVEKDASKMTLLQAMFQAQIREAIEKKDREALKFLLEQSGELNRMEISRPAEGNFFNVESMKQIINNNGFLETTENDEEFIEEEAIVVEDLKLE